MSRRRVSEREKVRAMDRLASNLGTNLGSLRCSGFILKWAGYQDGYHYVSDWKGRLWSICLVIGSVEMCVSAFYACLLESDQCVLDDVLCQESGKAVAL